MLGNISMNSTPFATEYDRTTQADWLIPVIFNVTMLSATVWLIISLVHHGLKTKKWKKFDDCNCRKCSLEKLRRGMVFTIVLVTAVFVFLHLFFTLININIGFRSGDDGICDAMSYFVFISYMCCSIFTYLFLWNRQRLFYANNLLSINYSKTLKFFSGFSLAFIFIFNGSLNIWGKASIANFSSKEGCIVSSPVLYTPVWLYYAILFGLASCFGQFTLLGLFIYAIKVSNRVRQIPQSSISSVSEVASPDNNRQKKKTSSARKIVKKILRKTTIFAVASVFCDFLPMTHVAFFKDEYYRIFLLLFNVNAFLNLMFLILSFVQYKAMIFSPCFLNQKEALAETSAGRSANKSSVGS